MTPPKRRRKIGQVTPSRQTPRYAGEDFSTGKWAVNNLVLGNSQKSPMVIIGARIIAAIIKTTNDTLETTSLGILQEHPAYYGDNLISGHLSFTMFFKNFKEYNVNMAKSLKKLRTEDSLISSIYHNQSQWQTIRGGEDSFPSKILSYSEEDMEKIQKHSKNYSELKTLAGEGLISHEFLKAMHKARHAYGRMSSSVTREEDSKLSRMGVYDFLFSKTLPAKRPLAPRDCWDDIIRCYPEAFPNEARIPMEPFL
jgi:hypothetical protein